MCCGGGTAIGLGGLRISGAATAGLLAGGGLEAGAGVANGRTTGVGVGTCTGTCTGAGTGAGTGAAGWEGDGGAALEAGVCLVAAGG